MFYLIYVMKPVDFTGLYIHVYLPESWVGAGTWHQADSTRHRAEEFGPGINQDIANGQSQPLGTPLMSGHE